MALVTGTAGNDVLVGTASDDVLEGLTGADKMAGGAGSDRYFVDQAADAVKELANKGTNDAIVSAVSLTLAANVETLELVGGALNGKGNTLHNVITGNALDNKLDGGAGHDLLSGGLGNDTLIGSTGNDYLAGGAGLNLLQGGAGNDVLHGLGGDNVMQGGTGNDHYIVDNAGDQVIETSGQGTDRIESYISFDLSAGGANVENLALTGNDNINGTGNALNNRIGGNTKDNILDGGAGNDEIGGGSGKDTLIGGSGNDVLRGDAGDDSLLGGKGNDIYILDFGTDAITELAGEGSDEVRTSISYALGANLENLVLEVGAGDLEGAGNDQDNVITGNESYNILDGKGGNDTLAGGGGNDILDGGTGNDVMAGGQGDDDYYVDSTKDRVTEKAGEGDSDRVYSTVNYVLGSNLEDLKLVGNADLVGTGNSLHNFLTGGAGNDKLDGGRGNDSLNGQGGDDTLLGGDGNDSLVGGTGKNTLTGGKGNDSYTITSLDDLVVEQAGQGTDHIRAAFSFSLAASAANVEDLTLDGAGDFIGIGNAANNSIRGNQGHNAINGLAGNDTLYGGPGNDLLLGSEGDDELLGSTGDDDLRGGEGNDVLDGDFGTNKLAGGIGNDTYLLGLGTDTIVELAGEGIDTVISSATTSLALAGFENIENLTLISAAKDGTGNALNNCITGNSGANNLFGAEGNDTLIGGLGDDTLRGGIGNDAMIGGLGGDDYYVDDKGDKVTEAANQGVDTIHTHMASYTLGSNLENLVIGSLAGAATGIGNASSNQMVGNGDANLLDGKGGNDELIGNDGDDTLIGGAGHDGLYGGAGNDSMAGGSGNDLYAINSAGDKVTELAGQGTDGIRATIDIDLFSKAFAGIENLYLDGVLDLNGYGNASANIMFGNSGDNELLGQEGNDRLEGELGKDELFGNQGNDTLLGGDGDDLLTGDEGNDFLDGGANANTLRGGAGNDIYVVNSVADTVEESANAGRDEIRASVTWSLAALANVENLTLIDNGNINGTGNTLANVITGNSGDNALNGWDGNDTLTGGLGNDQLDGWLGNDRMIGGKGDDLYFVDSAKDSVIEKAKEGIDRVASTISYTLGANVEHLDINSIGDVNGTGNTLDNGIGGGDGRNKLDGGAGNDQLNGNDGDDTLLGGTGNDQLLGGEGKDELRGGAGNDYLSGDAGDDRLLGEAGNDTLSGGMGNDDLGGGTGNDALDGGSGNDALDGGSGNDAVDGGDGNDTLLSGAGHDALNGGLGADDMRGGTGNDFYYVNDAGDKVTELAGQGTDTIATSIAFNLETFGPHVENVQVATNAGLAINGNKLNNRMVGYTGNDALSGGLGNDTLTGEAGNDTLTGGAGNDLYLLVDASDTISELANQGIDVVEALTSYTLGANLENLTLLGTAQQGTGNELANLIIANNDGNALFGLAGNDALTGGDGNDELDGGTGKDVMRGGKGEDYYYVDDVSDKIIEKANEGVDEVITTLARYTIVANVERLSFNLANTDAVGTGNAFSNGIFGGGGNDTLHGLAGDDGLSGGDGDDTLYGGAGNDEIDDGAGSGNDVMIGGAGNDDYSVDSAGDVVQEAANGGIDNVGTTIDYTLGAHIENAHANATGVTITGNDLNNVLTGNAGAETLNGGKGDDTLLGFAGQDQLSGGDGNDLIEGGLGVDALNGGAGNDLFRYTLQNPADLNTIGGDLLTGFETGKDKIDVYDLFEDFNVISDDVVGDGYLRLFVNNDDTLVQFDKDGGGDSFVTLAVLQNVTNATLADVIYPQDNGVV